MDLLIVGVNHQTAPVALREKVAFTPDQLGPALDDLKHQQNLTEVSVLSTCNRTEVYAIATAEQASHIVQWLATYHDESEDTLLGCVYTLYLPPQPPSSWPASYLPIWRIVMHSWLVPVKLSRLWASICGMPTSVSW